MRYLVGILVAVATSALLVFVAWPMLTPYVEVRSDRDVVTLFDNATDRIEPDEWPIVCGRTSVGRLYFTDRANLYYQTSDREPVHVWRNLDDGGIRRIELASDCSHVDIFWRHGVFRQVYRQTTFSLRDPEPVAHFVRRDDWDRLSEVDDFRCPNANRTYATLLRAEFESHVSPQTEQAVIDAVRPVLNSLEPCAELPPGLQYGMELNVRLTLAGSRYSSISRTYWRRKRRVFRKRPFVRFGQTSHRPWWSSHLESTNFSGCVETIE